MKMDSGIIVALISVGGSLLGTFVGVVAGSKLIVWRLEKLECKIKEIDSLQTCAAEIKANCTRQNVLCVGHFDSVQRDIHEHELVYHGAQL